VQSCSLENLRSVLDWQVGENQAGSIAVPPRLEILKRKDAKKTQRGPLPQPNTPQLEDREFYRDEQDEQDKTCIQRLILFILFIPVKFLLLELSALNLASKTRNLRISIKNSF
jgi:hypothetical protein